MSPSDKPQDAATTPPAPWWHEPTMWLVVGGPTVVVFACMATLALALIYPDPVLEEKSAASTTAAQQPAQKARNHAATGGK